ncbi:hypothetical protein TNIN_23101 [Trichonephila inaurata madagascariensis]|uniref:Uncharacterized protein n=1 Tax=Trichonephila inaurata madagascariensis TaxID=2747483 RepID=A0A8X6Y3B8_9ARAC|nr:hypothetical protein TNIN_23101 [Trichonephila inaurata madagascariensis]
MRWTRHGIMDKKECRVYYSCQNKTHQFRVGFNVSKRLRNSVLILYKIPLRGRHYYTTLVCAHALIEKKNEVVDIIGDLKPRSAENILSNPMLLGKVSTPRLMEMDLVSRRI